MNSSPRLSVQPPLLLSCALLGCVASAPAAKSTTPARAQIAEASPAPPRQLPERSELPLVVRETLSSSMERHGEELTFLLGSVVLLDYGGVEMAARKLAEEPKLGRPRPREKGTLNALLPGAFFVHQDQLTQRAKELSVAAHEKDDAKLVKAFGALAETCVGCHSAYLHADLDGSELADD